MPIRITMPQMGESVVEGTIERWNVQPGDFVEKDQTVCEITTDKVDAEIPAPESGVVRELLWQEGETVEVGAAIALLEPGTREAGQGLSQAAAPKRAVAEPAPPPREAGADSGRASPLARRLASEHGVDLAEIRAGGGRVTKQDLLEHLAASEAESSRGAVRDRAAGGSVPATLGDFLSRMKLPAYALREGDTEVPFSPIRRRIAEHMVVSKIVSPHVGTVAEIDLGRVHTLRERHRASFESQRGLKLTFLPFVLQATVRALREFPRMNASVVGQTVVERNGIHLGVAVETERGLLVPVVRDADRLSLVGLAESVADLARRAREREITADELAGGSFTISNPGRRGNLYGFAVINQPQVGILRIGELRKRPVVVERDGEEMIAIRPMMHLALSYDHRVIDGVTGNGFLYRVGELLEQGEFDLG